MGKSTEESDTNRSVKEFTTVSQSWGTTEIQVEKIIFTWTIKNFSFYNEDTGHKIVSPVFPKEDSITKWVLELFPTGALNDKDGTCMALFIASNSCGVEEIQIKKCKVSVLDARLERIHTSQFNHRVYFDQETNWGFPQFVNREFLFDAENGALPNDKLTILCEFNVETRLINKSGKISTLEPQCDLYNDFAFLFDNEKFSDVILCTEGKEFFAHKIILSANSSIFNAMFSHDMRENISNRVEIKDISSELLREMLGYIYSRKIPHLKDMAIKLLLVADKYDLKTLKLICEKELCARLSIENVAEIFQIAFIYDAEHLKFQAKQFLVAHASEVGKTNGWKSMVLSYPHLATEAFLALASE